MKALVCDDEAQVREQLQKAVEELIGVGSCDVCGDQESLLRAVENNTYDVVIMDIEWNGEERGIHFAEMLKAQSPLTEVIYLTGYTQKYVQQVFFHHERLLCSRSSAGENPAWCSVVERNRGSAAIFQPFSGIGSIYQEKCLLSSPQKAFCRTFSKSAGAHKGKKGPLLFAGAPFFQPLR